MFGENRWTNDIDAIVALRQAGRMAIANTRRDVVFVVFPGFQSLDLTGPFEVFGGVNDLLGNERAGKPAYRLRVAASTKGSVTTERGLQIHAEVELRHVRAPLDTLVVVGGFGAVDIATDDPALIRHVGRLAASARRVVSICTGSFVLAAAGVLDGRTACTHWARASLLGRRFPNVTVDGESLYHRDGNVWTSAGVTAGIDLALALVAEDHGSEIAQTVSRWLVMFYRRPGGQSQFAMSVRHGTSDRDALRSVQEAVTATPAGNHCLAALASRASMSERNFLRVFTRELGVTPAKFVESIRVNAACLALETTAAGIDAVAREVGFGTTETMRRTFIRVKGVAPSDYRARFSRTTS